MPAVIESPDAAARRVRSGDTILVSGFGGVGSPDVLLGALVETDATDLTCVTTTSGVPTQGLGLLLRQGRLRRLVTNFLTRNPEAMAAYREGTLSAAILPMGTMVEAIRAGGAGIPAFYVATARGTELAAALATKEFGGKPYVLQEAIHGDIAFVRAHKADRLGNLTFHNCERALGPVMATAATTTIAEVDEIVDVGELLPEEIEIPHLVVDVVVVRGADPPQSLEAIGRRAPTWTERDHLIAERASRELLDGGVVNLGSGIPSLVKQYLENRRVFIQTENGLLGAGPIAEPELADPSITDAMGLTVTLRPGASIVDSRQVFDFIRGGHVDVSVMGAMEVSGGGLLSNWSALSAGHLGVGGAMDLAEGAGRLVVAMNHTLRDGTSRVVAENRLPITSTRPIDTLVTDLAVFDFPDGQMVLRELQPGVDLQQVRDLTTAHFETRAGFVS